MCANSETLTDNDVNDSFFGNEEIYYLMNDEEIMENKNKQLPNLLLDSDAVNAFNTCRGLRKGT